MNVQTCNACGCVMDSHQYHRIADKPFRASLKDAVTQEDLRFSFKVEATQEFNSTDRHFCIPCQIGALKKALFSCSAEPATENVKTP